MFIRQQKKRCDKIKPDKINIVSNSSQLIDKINRTTNRDAVFFDHNFNQVNL